tara:strand:- start:7 stop:231 length:225 start_codon:yes stop_codon:yes gene_type:complete
MIDMIKKYLPYLSIGVILAILVLALPNAIRFFFRGFLLLLENPLEAACFFGITAVFVTMWIWFEEYEEEIDKKS